MPALEQPLRAESVPGDISGRASPAQDLGGPSEDETELRPHLPRLGDRRNPRREERAAFLRASADTFQINGRSDKPMHLNTGDDLYCVHSCSLWLDLRILTVTPFAALGGRGVF